MNLNIFQLLGLAMVIFAFGAQVFIPGSVVYYSTVSSSVSFIPNASTTSPNNPLQYPASSPYFPAQAVLSGISQLEVLNVSVQISQWSGSVWNLIGTYPLSYGTTTGASLVYGYLFAPLGSPGSLYAFSFSVVTTDLGSFAGIGYIQIATLSGYFSINGFPATNTTFLRVSNPLLTFTYNITQTGFSSGSITPYVIVKNGTTQLAQVTMAFQSLNNGYFIYSATYTLPSSGTYTMSGFVTYGSQTYQQMNIVSDWGSANLTSMSFTDIYVVIGLFGVAFIFLGARKKKES